MSKKKTRHLLLVRNPEGVILAVDTKNNIRIFNSTSVTDSLGRLEWIKSKGFEEDFKANKESLEWANRTTDFAKGHFTKIVIG